MANNFPPAVTVKNTNVEIGAKVLFKDLFTVSEIEGNAITKYRFRDNGSANYSGFFALAGVKQLAGGWIEIDAAQLNSVYYHSALIVNNESIGVQVYDGKYWSTASYGVLSTVTPNNQPPIVTTTNGSVLETEFRSITDLISVSDPDGYPITQYYLVDRENHAVSGYLTLYGVKLQSATWHAINASDLAGIRYVGGEWGPEAENIGVMAFDGKNWSAVAEFEMLTTANLYAPVVSAYNLAAAVGRVIDAVTMFTVSDQDGNTMKQIRFLDTGTDPNSGYFTINGVRQTSDVFFTVPFNQLSTVQYHYSQFPEFERYNVQVYDGRHWSTIAAGDIHAVVKPIIVPTDSPTDNDTMPDADVVFDELEERTVLSMITRGDSGPPFIQYQVIDLTPDTRTANLLHNQNPLTARTVYTFSAGDFNDVEIEGAVNDLGRSYDQILVRGFNGVFWSDWQRFNVSTEPVGPDSLSGGPDLTPKQVVNGKTVFTYTFIEGDSPDPANPYPPLPTYYAINDPEAIGTIPIAASQKEMVRSILANYESMANVDFIEVPFQANAANAMITIGACDMTGAQAYILAGPFNAYGSKSGDMWVDVDGVTDPSNPDTAWGGFGRMVFIHEFGHLLGFKHPHEYSPALPVSLDHNGNTVMSYSGVPGSLYSNPNGLNAPATPMLYDIMEFQRLYGANMQYRTGNDTYVYELGDSALQAIWDAGGDDTLNFGNQVQGGTIDLRQGRRTTLNGVDNALLIPFNCFIENARGSKDSDVIIGNELRNLLFGNEGADSFNGQGGDDVLRGGTGNDAYTWELGGGTDTIREESMGGREILTIQDASGRLNSLENDFTFRRFGRDLRVDIGFDREETVGSVIVKDMLWGGCRVETLRFTDGDGNQIGVDIDLNSIFVQGTDVRTRFQLTSNQTQWGYIAVPV